MECSENTCIFFLLYDTLESYTTLKFSSFCCCGSNCAPLYWRFHKPIHCNILVKLKTACIDFLFLFSSSFFFFFFPISCAYPCGGQRECLTKYFSLNQAERKEGFQGQLECKMLFITSIILSVSSALKREGFFHDTNYSAASHTEFFHLGLYLLSQGSPTSPPVLVWWCELLTFGKLS